MRKAFYAISGDPITNGHTHVLHAAADMFDMVVLALAVNSDKKYTFSLDERREMVEKALHSRSDRLQITTIEPHEMTAKAARRAGATFLVRGIRDHKDLDYELRMAHFNTKIEPLVQTVWIPTPAHLADVSSSMVKGLVGLEGWHHLVETMVPRVVYERLIRWEQERNVKS